MFRETTVFILVLLGTAWAFPKGAEEELQFKRLYVDPLLPPEIVIGRITNGKEAPPHSIPYQAYLIFTGAEGRWSCGGSLISKNYVLTAGHCVDGATSVDVYLGAHNLNVQESTRIIITSRSLRLHENYNGNTISNDIGLIQLPQSVKLNTNINTVALPTHRAGSFEGSNATVSGWGLTKGDGKTSPVLLEVTSTVISNRQCVSYYNIIRDSEVCISGSGGVGSCNGDSGGPLVANNEQIGIVSFGASGCVSGYPSVFTRVSSFIDWIQRHSDVVDSFKSHNLIKK